MLNSSSRSKIGGSFHSYVVYLGAMVGLALVFRSIAQPASPKAAAPAADVARSAEDSKRLRDYLGLNSSSEALVEFLDLECPPCRGLWLSLSDKDHARSDFHVLHYPLKMHENAFVAAVATELAAQRVPRHQVVDQIYRGEIKPTPAALTNYLKNVGISIAPDAKKAAPFADRVREHIALAKSLGVSGTPSLFLLKTDGSMVQIRNTETMRKFFSSPKQMAR
jgi:hypothetical protein